MNYVNKNVNFSIDQEASSDPILEGGEKIVIFLKL